MDAAVTLLKQIFRSHRVPIGLTYSLTCFEKGLQVLFPWATGVAIDSLVKSEWLGVGILCGLWVLHLCSATFRQMYDTRLFTRIYGDLAISTIIRQRAAGNAVSAIAARSSLSRECIDFVERDVPMLVQTALTGVGSLVMMFYYSTAVGLIGLALLVPAVICNWWFARRALRLNRSINNRLEQEVGVIEACSTPQVSRHFSMLRTFRVGLSDAEAINRGVVEVFMIAALAASLVLYTASGSHTPGAIYAVFVYVWSLFETIWVVPTAVNAITRVQDIGARVQPGGD
jgi:ABC-type multidrug transport system fused ATPase/permease subunit